VLPYAVGVVLFAPDLVHFVLGNQWEPAVVLLQGLAIVGAITQLGFNWFSFFRAHGDTRSPAVEAVAGAVAFLALAPAGLLLDGFHGFVLARIAAALVPFAVRGVYVRRLLPDVRYRQIVAPTLIPIALASAAAMAVRVALWGGRRTVAQAIAEAVLFVAVYAVTALRRERVLVLELLGGLRGAGGSESVPMGDDDVLQAAALPARPGSTGQGPQ
jgi:O-antigen/teichoic acid export membrane protein